MIVPPLFAIAGGWEQSVTSRLWAATGEVILLLEDILKQSRAFAPPDGLESGTISTTVLPAAQTSPPRQAAVPAKWTVQPFANPVPIPSFARLNRERATDGKPSSARELTSPSSEGCPP